MATAKKAARKVVADTVDPGRKPTRYVYPKPGKSRKHFDIDADLAKNLRVYAALQGTTMKEVVNAALAAYFKSKGFKAR